MARTMESLGLLVLFWIGVAGLALGIGIRLGRLRRWVLLYRDFQQPWFIRNGAFAVLPASGLAIVVPVGKYAMVNSEDPVASSFGCFRPQ